MSLITNLVTFILKFLFYFVCCMVVLVIVPQFPPHVNFTVIDIPPDQPREGPLTINNAINNAQKIYENQIISPEALQVYNGEVYLSLATGEIVKFAPGGPIQFVTKIGNTCAGLYEEHICGRPLGFQIDGKNQKLYVADAYLGLWKIDLRNGQKDLLVPTNTKIEGKLPKLFNFLALADNGDIFYSISTTDFYLSDCLLAFLADPSGRLMHYNAATNTSKVLLENLYFANGVVVSPDQQFVLVAELLRKTILKYYIAGVNKGKSEIFLSGLPGTPDNMKVAPDGSGALVTLAAVLDVNDNSFKFLAKTPLLRKLISRLHFVVRLPFEYLNSVYPNVIFEQIIYKIGHLTTLPPLPSHISGIIHVNWEGKIIASYYNHEYSMTDFAVLGDRMYSGNVVNQNYVVSYKAPAGLIKLFSKKESVKSEHKNMKK